MSTASQTVTCLLHMWLLWSKKSNTQVVYSRHREREPERGGAGQAGLSAEVCVCVEGIELKGKSKASRLK